MANSADFENLTPELKFAVIMRCDRYRLSIEDAEKAFEWLKNCPDEVEKGGRQFHRAARNAMRLRWTVIGATIAVAIIYVFDR